MDRQCLDHAERKGRATNATAREAERGRIAVVERAVEVLALRLACHAQPGMVDLLSFSEQDSIGIEWWHGIPPSAAPSIDRARAGFNHSETPYEDDPRLRPTPERPRD